MVASVEFGSVDHFSKVGQVYREFASNERKLNDLLDNIKANEVLESQALVDIQRIINQFDNFNDHNANEFSSLSGVLLQKAKSVDEVIFTIIDRIDVEISKLNGVFSVSSSFEGMSYSIL